MSKTLWICSLFLAACATVDSPRRTAINGVEIDYLVTGNGPPLYLLHGGMESRNSFENQIPVLAQHFTVVALDSREQGRSSASDSQVTYEAMSSDLIALAQHLGHERISIVGLSDGGITAITTAIDRPDFIEKLVLIGATYHFDAYPEATRQFIANHKWDGSTNPKQYPGIFVQHYLTGHPNLSGFGALLDEMAIMWTTSPEFEKSDLSKISAQTLIINGDHEDVQLEHAIDLYDGVPDAQLFVVPNATHFALQEKPELLNQVILNFLLETQ